ncbi:OmpH family outer membrane protein [Petrotoga sp. 9PWA.NaAc.5.4]|uniref:OmpH family outer membrane protein n=1 Tax=Petrotoga sp. 9PWA.NaAc.5.4 TaxID=1434328 RepID=UPI000CBA736F|nr:OmpH family outer membrane protein [Petrotoga sp. 9PWA.NaAc.5.4]PNR94674.1 hypothetical protein X924_06270 [Petrotoga sp. 9PWA.NaAc.5.4]
MYSKISKKVLVSLMFFVLGFSIVFSQTTQNLKIGYVNFSKTVESYYKWKDLESLYQLDLQYYQSKINELQEELNQLQRSGASQEVLQQNYLRTQQRINQYQQDLQSEYQRKIDSIASEVLFKISQYAKENQYDLILNENAVLYFKPEIDLTDKIIEYINKK